jgi:DNA-directed RNA polymerase alpha subunit
MTRIPLPSWERRTRSSVAQLTISIAELGLSPRTVNYLEKHGVRNLKQLLDRAPEILPCFPNFGKETQDQILVSLEKSGFPRESRTVE